jgi:hypothetical protein
LGCVDRRDRAGLNRRRLAVASADRLVADIDVDCVAVANDAVDARRANDNN